MPDAKASDCAAGWPYFEMVQPARYTLQNSNVLYMNLRDVLVSIGTPAALDFKDPLHFLLSFSALARGTWYRKGVWVRWSCLMRLREQGGTEQVFIGELASLSYGEVENFFIDEVWGQRILDAIAQRGIRAESYFAPARFLRKRTKQVQIIRKDGSTYLVDCVTC